MKFKKGRIGYYDVKRIFGKEIFNQSCVKTIYGSNGAGKSGIAHAYDIFRELVLNDFPFSDPLFTPKFCQLINKKSMTFGMSNTFAINDTLMATFAFSPSSFPYAAYA